MSSSTAIDFKKTDLRVSTMVITANWNTKINLDKLFEQMNTVLIPIWYPGEGILKMEHKNVVIGTSYRDLFTNRKITSKSFYNQSTMVIRKNVEEGNPFSFKEVNVKLFANGGIQMTGVQSEEFAHKTILWLHEQFCSLKENVFAGPSSVCKVSVQLINTDYLVSHNINQEALHSLLCDKYNLFSMLDKTIYQGVNTKYFYNTTNNKPGICSCKKPCKGQGTGEGEGQCKRITLSVFRTGTIIITGARNMKQIETTYNFINKVFEDNSNNVFTTATA
jgi:TATA-box binding protein (TBP) (component of TFIID and TFIIIB)